MYPIYDFKASTVDYCLTFRPTSDNVGVLENEIKSLKGQIQTLGKENEKNSKVEMDKFKQTVEELKSENAK